MLKLIALAAILCACIGCGSKKPSPPPGITTLPTIQYLDTDSTIKVIDKSGNKGQAVVIMYFDSDCHLCKEETTSILKSIDDISNTRIYMLSNEPLENIRAHKSKYGITDGMPLSIGKDIDKSFINVMKVSTIPSTIIYDSDHKIVRFYNGEVLWPEINQELKNRESL